MKSLHLSVVIKLQSLVPESLIYDITNKYFTNNMYNSRYLANDLSTPISLQ